jgi:glycosyltransferase involved in cell wall biosynthesis
MVKGGIAAVVNGYYDSRLERDYNIVYVESYKDGNKVQKTLKAAGGYLHFMKVLMIDKPDVIHMHTSFGPSFFRSIPFIYIASWARKPMINHIHGADFEAFYMSASERKKNLIRKTYDKCAALIALSEEWKARLSQVVTAEKVSIIENYSILHEDALQQKLTRSCHNTVLFLGEIGRRKGCYDIPAIVEQVVKAVPDVKFILGGSGDTKQITALLEEKGIKNNVLLPGWVRGVDKDRLLREADVFLLPSYNEGMPMSILDAMGYGLPIVSTDVGGISKLVHNGHNGYLCQAGDIAELSASIVRLLQDIGSLKAYGKNSFSIVKNKYALDVHLDRLETLYNACEEFR